MHAETLKKRVCSLLLAFTMGGCALIYRPAVKQGNSITESMASQLQPGMSKRQVRYLLGTPVLESPRTASRWEYIWYVQPGHGKPVEKRLTLIFAGETLRQIRRAA